MNKEYDLGSLSWTLTGFTPHEWRGIAAPEVKVSTRAVVPTIPAPVPGSVQQALRLAGCLPDWNMGENARNCEWVENRHWIYAAAIPDSWVRAGKRQRLVCEGLDYCGEILLNGETLYRFSNSYIPHRVDLAGRLRERENILQIVFECPPRWLGQFGYTSRMTEWKPRYNYTWDWTARLVQLGIWDRIYIEESSGGAAMGPIQVAAGYDIEALTGSLRIAVGPEALAGRVSARLSRDGKTIWESERSASNDSGFHVEGLPVDPWWPNGLGAQPLYQLELKWQDGNGDLREAWEHQIGFKHFAWRACEGAPGGALDWIAVANGRPFFLQGINWTPILPNFADVTEAQYRHLLQCYRDMGVNMLRVWGGGFLEKECFYRLCDELGLLVWQEFPLSSSGVDNYPPDDAKAMEELEEIAASYIVRRRNHVCHFLWCGGNELFKDKEGTAPVGMEHPLMQRFAALAARLDPGKRFIPSTPNGPSFGADEKNFGRGMHWSVNGPWKAEGLLEEGWASYWSKDDALARTETGSPGPASAELIRRYRGDLPELPVSTANPLWRRAPWWIDSAQFAAEMGHEPETLEEYVAWGQARQARALEIAASACKKRFPRCGGFVVWMGHDSFPCPANTSVIDFDGNLKPAARALAGVFLSPLIDTWNEHRNPAP
jgi:beta-mannosidase